MISRSHVFAWLGLGVLSFAVSGCSDPYNESLNAFDVNTNILATLVDSNGQPLPDAVAAIEKQYGILAQQMNFVVPGISIELTSPSGTTDSSQLTSQFAVNNWSTNTNSVVNGAVALPFTLHVDGLINQTCVGNHQQNCPLADPSVQTAYANYFAAQAQSALTANMTLRLVGTDNSGNQAVQTLTPAKVTFNCLIDLSAVNNTAPAADFSQDSEDYSKAIQCSGTAQFALQ